MGRILFTAAKRGLATSTIYQYGSRLQFGLKRQISIWQIRRLSSLCIKLIQICHRISSKHDAWGDKKMQRKKNSFATDLSVRCQSEFQNIHRQANGDALKLQKHIAMATDAILLCYQGHHRLCLSKSTVCMGE